METMTKEEEQLTMLTEHLKATRECLGDPETKEEDRELLSGLEADLLAEISEITQSTNERR